ncbi:MAG TPA: hypothetical protein VFC45_03845 [Pseudolabrys sp.]|nr:hypothetical protein [Pseudolabrys sp.]
MRIDLPARKIVAAALFSTATVFGASAQPPANPAAQSVADVFHEAESKYMFGFIDGADIGNEGEKAIEYEATGSFQKRGGGYSAIEHELEFEHVLTQNFAYELSAHGIQHSISGVEGLDDRNSAQFSGASAKLRYLIIGRGPGSPIGLTISAEPEWSRIDGTDGTQVQAYASEFRVVADTELITNRLYAALNLIYAPEVAKPADTGMWERSSSVGLGAGLTYRITPTFAMGVAAEYDRAYDGLTLQTFDGHAFFAGPTMQINLSRKMLLAAAFMAQVAGHAVDDPRPLDLTNFEKYRANLKFEVEF